MYSRLPPRKKLGQEAQKEQVLIAAERNQEEKLEKEARERAAAARERAAANPDNPLKRERSYNKNNYLPYKSFRPATLVRENAFRRPLLKRSKHWPERQKQQTKQQTTQQTIFNGNFNEKHYQTAMEEEYGGRKD